MCGVFLIIKGFPRLNFTDKLPLITKERVKKTYKTPNNKNDKRNYAFLFGQTLRNCALRISA